MKTFVSIGNAIQPFPRLLDSVCNVISCLPQPLFVQHGWTPFCCDKGDVVDFLGMEEFATAVAQAELVILHAGAGSIIHAIEAGKIPIVMPRRKEMGEHVDNHQVEFAYALQLKDKVVVVESENDFATAIERARNLQAHNSTVGREPPMVALVRGVLEEA